MNRTSENIVAQYPRRSRPVLAIGAFALLAVAGVAQPAATDRTVMKTDATCRVIERGPDHVTWERVAADAGGAGGRTHRYTELSPCLSYRKNGAWLECREEIEVLEGGGAAAIAGRHQVYFPSDIY